MSCRQLDPVETICAGIPLPPPTSEITVLEGLLICSFVNMVCAIRICFIWLVIHKPSFCNPALLFFFMYIVASTPNEEEILLGWRFQSRLWAACWALAGTWHVHFWECGIHQRRGKCKVPGMCGLWSGTYRLAQSGGKEQLLCSTGTCSTWVRDNHCP